MVAEHDLLPVGGDEISSFSSGSSDSSRDSRYILLLLDEVKVQNPCMVPSDAVLMGVSLLSKDETFDSLVFADTTPAERKEWGHLAIARHNSIPRVPTWPVMTGLLLGLQFFSMVFAGVEFLLSKSWLLFLFY